MKKIETLTKLIIIMVFASCSSESADDDISPPINTNVTYSVDIRPIIDEKCISCHNNPPEKNAPMPLTTYTNVKDATLNRGLISQVESGSMPQVGSPLSSVQVQLIKDWQTGNFKE